MHHTYTYTYIHPHTAGRRTRVGHSSRKDLACWRDGANLPFRYALRLRIAIFPSSVFGVFHTTWLACTQELVERYADAERAAKGGHRGMWVHGDMTGNELVRPSCCASESLQCVWRVSGHEILANRTGNFIFWPNNLKTPVRFAKISCVDTLQTHLW